jgi:putative endonuclease
LYVGVTNNLVRRIAEHKAKINKGFTYKYNCNKLTYYERFDLIIDAIAREKQLKNWKREWKNKLVNDFNPEWKDLSEEIGVNDDYINAAKNHYKGIAGQARNDVSREIAVLSSAEELQNELLNFEREHGKKE